MSPSKGYHRIQDQSFTSDVKASTRQQMTTYGIKLLDHKLSLGLFISLLLGTNFTSWFLAKRNLPFCVPSPLETPSIYAGLLTNEPHHVFEPDSPYASSNDTVTLALWQSIDDDSGVVALPDTFVKSFELPKAQRFPWDHSKGLYLLSGFHSLHCVKTIAIALHELKYNRSLSRPWHHVMHCIDVLRRDVLCHADDTPRWADTVGKKSGLNQTRQCRSWAQLERWADSYNACFRNINASAPAGTIPTIERFKYCPEGSPYRERIARIWGADFLERMDRGEDV